MPPCCSLQFYIICVPKDFCCFWNLYKHHVGHILLILGFQCVFLFVRLSLPFSFLLPECLLFLFESMLLSWGGLRLIM